MRKKRHNYTPEEKVSIDLVEHVAVSDLCEDAVSASAEDILHLAATVFRRTAQRHLPVKTVHRSVARTSSSKLN